MNNKIVYVSKDFNGLYVEVQRFFEHEDFNEVFIECTAYEGLQFAITRFDIETFEKMSSPEVKQVAFTLLVNYKICLTYKKPMALANIIEVFYDEIKEKGTAISLFNFDNLPT